jgi:L-asparaginase/Glu-tRNA(Gln) amidotransferase subunit D
MTVRVKPISLLIIYTGGTIGMVRDPKTGILHPFPFENIEYTAKSMGVNS